MRRLSSFLLTTCLVLSAPAFASDFPRVRIETTAGDFVVELDATRAPLTVANFLNYVEAGHYTGTIFHRVISGFVIQGGGFDKNLNPKPAGEQVVNESGNGWSNRRMTIAMARTNDPHSADAQFYINLADNVALDPKPTRWGYAVFGMVIEGSEIVDDIGHRPTAAQGAFQNLPASPVVIESMTIEKDAAD